MNPERWTAVDRYLTDLLVPPDPVVEAAPQHRRRGGPAATRGLPDHGQAAPSAGAEPGGTLDPGDRHAGRVQTIWLARALPADGPLITLEAVPERAEVARANIARAGLESLVELRLGRALETLSRLAEGGGPFDLIFIDADKAGNPDYLAWALELSRRGSLIVADNVVRAGAVLDAAGGDPSVEGVRRFLELLAAEPRVCATAIQTVGGKGYDGLAIALVTAGP